RRPHGPTLFPYTTLFQSDLARLLSGVVVPGLGVEAYGAGEAPVAVHVDADVARQLAARADRLDQLPLVEPVERPRQRVEDPQRPLRRLGAPAGPVGSARPGRAGRRARRPDPDRGTL